MARAISKRSLATAREEVLLERMSSRRRSSATGGMELMPELLEEVEPDVEEEVGGAQRAGLRFKRSCPRRRCKAGLAWIGRCLEPGGQRRRLVSTLPRWPPQQPTQPRPAQRRTLPCQMAKLPRWQSTLTVRALLIGAVLGACFSIISLKLGLTTGGARRPCWPMHAGPAD